MDRDSARRAHRCRVRVASRSGRSYLGADSDPREPGLTDWVRDLADQVVFVVPNDGGSITSKGNDGAPSGDNVWWVDFSPLATPGSYRIYSSALLKQSHDFVIADDVYNQPTLTALKTFYYQRCNTPKEVAYAGD